MRWWSQIFCCFLSHLSCHLVVLFRINGVVYCQDDPTRWRDKCNKTAVNCQPLFIDIYGALYFFIHLCVLRANIETKFGKGNDDGEEERRRRSRKRLNWVSTSKSLFPFQYKNRFSVVVEKKIVSDPISLLNQSSSLKLNNVIILKKR